MIGIFPFDPFRMRYIVLFDNCHIAVSQILLKLKIPLVKICSKSRLRTAALYVEIIPI